MHLKILSTLALLGTAFASPLENRAVFCPEAARFGFLEVTPATVAPGEVRLAALSRDLAA